MDLSDKAALRLQVREALGAITADARASRSRQLCRLLLEQQVWLGAASLLCFAPLSDEPDIAPAVDDALQKSKVVAVPRFDRAHHFTHALTPSWLVRIIHAE